MANTIHSKYLTFKRLIDLIVAFVVFIILLPLVLLIIVLLSIELRGNPFFIQKRPGKDNKIFNLLKFRTMNYNKDDKGQLLPDYMRLTKIGKLVRKLSLDELPQFLNVIKGDMSLIGPRPLLVEYLQYYNNDQIQRHKVRPGITGWAQVNGRNLISWEDKFKLDIWYVNNLSFVVDLNIFISTIYKIFKREGINSTENITMEKFTGTK